MRRCVYIARRGLSAKAETSTAETVPIVAPKEEEAPKVATQATVYRPPYYRKSHKIHESKHLLQDEFPNAGDASGAGLRLFDYFKTAEMVERMPTIKEKIDFVSPYERPWTRAEKTWRRDWHPTLMATRKAWAVPPVPAYFDVLHYYQNLTKTRLEVGPLDDIYKGLLPPTGNFERAYIESVKSVGFDPNTASESDVQKILGMILDDAMGSLVHNVHRLADRRVSYDVASEAFWIRAGFMFLYDEEEVGTRDVIRRLSNFPKFIGDDRRKLGELAFVHRDKLAAQVRSKDPLSHLHSLDNQQATQPVFSEPNDINFSPKVYNLWPDEKPLWQCPGYHVDVAESHSNGVLAFKSLAALRERVATWMGGQGGPEAEELFNEAAKAQAIISLFTTLCAQAHAQGFTQYTDVTRPFTSQMVLSDGQKYFFAVGQLNTLAINVECEGFHNPRTNLVRVEGPFDVYDVAPNAEGKKQSILNGKVLERILQMLMKQ